MIPIYSDFSIARNVNIALAGAVNKTIDIDGGTLLTAAAEKGDLEAVKKYIQEGAMVDLPKRNGEAPLLLAMKKQNFEIAEYLINCGASVNCSDNSGWSPLMSAARWDNVQTLYMLISNGANLSSTNSDLKTALDVAIMMGNERSIQILSNYEKK